MPVYGLKGFFQLTVALLAISALSVASALAQAPAKPLPYYSLSPAKVLVWPNGKTEEYVLAEFSEGQWKFLTPKDDVATVPPALKGLFTATNQQPRFIVPHGQNASYTLQLWHPAARIILVHQLRIAVMTREKVAVDDYSTRDASGAQTVTPALKLLQDAAGNEGMAVLSRYPISDLDAWINSIQQLSDPFITTLSNQAGPRWILVDKLSQEELNKLTGGIEVQPSTQTTITRTTPGQGAEIASIARLLQFLIFLDLVMLGGFLLYLWRRNRPKQAKQKPAQPRTQAQPSGKEAPEVLKSLLEIVGDVISAIEAQQLGKRHNMNELEDFAYQWVSRQYMAQLAKASDDTGALAKAYRAFQSRFLLREFATEDLSEVKNFVQLGRDARRVVAQMNSGGLQSAELQGLRGAAIFQVLPATLVALDQKLKGLHQQIDQYKAQLAENESLVNQARNLKGEVDRKNEQIYTLKKEITKLTAATGEMEKNRRELQTEYGRLETMIQRATQLSELSKACAKGKRSFLEQTGKPQAAAALAFLLDYSLFNLAEAILHEDEAQEAIMRGNLVRICEQGKAQKLSGFDPALFNSAQRSAHLPPVVSNDRHEDRVLFAYMLKMIREYGNLHVDFDFDVDATGVHRVA
jgi:hypothetical protein